MLLGSCSETILGQPLPGGGGWGGGNGDWAHVGSTNMPVMTIVPTVVLIRFNMILSSWLGMFTVEELRTEPLCVSLCDSCRASPPTFPYRPQREQEQDSDKHHILI